jgi:hypothetical protein
MKRLTYQFVYIYTAYDDEDPSRTNKNHMKPICPSIHLII